MDLYETNFPGFKPFSPTHIREGNNIWEKGFFGCKNSIMPKYKADSNNNVYKIEEWGATSLFSTHRINRDEMIKNNDSSGLFFLGLLGGGIDSLF